MKVGVFLGHAQPEVGGGYTFETEVLESLLRCAPESRHSFSVLGWFRQPPNASSIKNLEFLTLHRSLAPRLKSRFLRNIGNLAEYLRIATKPHGLGNWLEELIREKRIDLIWSLAPSDISTEVPHLTVVWDLQHRVNPWFPEVSAAGEWEAREKMYSHVLRRAAIVIAGTQAGKAEIERFYQVPAERIKILPQPTPSFALSAAGSAGEGVLAKYNISSGYLFYPAQLWPHKNHMAVLLAARLLRDKFDLVFPVVFVGADKGNERHLKRTVTELGLTAQVHFLGFVSRDDLVGLYRNALALTYTTFCGPDNIPPLEAFALGCPVIASNVSGSEEQLRDAALLVDPKRPDQLVDAIKSLHEDRELRQKLIERGLKRATEWTGHDYVKGIFSILDDFESVRRCWDR